MFAVTNEKGVVFLHFREYRDFYCNNLKAVINTDEQK